MAEQTELDSMNRLRVQAERKAALYRRALVLACYGDEAKVAFYVADAAAAQEDESGVPAASGLAQQLATAVEAIEAGHDPLCMSILRGKACSCGFNERNAGVPAASAPSSGIYAACRECEDCNHAGINDEHAAHAHCGACGWFGPEPKEDRCPECSAENVMGAACPKCGGRYRLIADVTVGVQEVHRG